MYLPAIMAFLHHLAAFTLVAALGVEVALFKPPLTALQARRIIVTDSLFGVSAGALLVVGLLRVFFFEKGADYYFSNVFFLTKLSLFVMAALISIYPTVLYLSWRKPVEEWGDTGSTRFAAQARAHVPDARAHGGARHPVLRSLHGARLRLSERLLAHTDCGG
jgi:putative membrane protein